MIRRGQISGKSDITVPTPYCAQSSSSDNRLRVASDVVLDASSQWLCYNGHKKITLFKKQSMYWSRTVILVLNGGVTTHGDPGDSAPA